MRQEANEAKHKSRMCTACKNENNVELLGWRSQSANASSIENIWAYSLVGKMRTITDLL